jgi:amino acid transporter
MGSALPKGGPAGLFIAFFIWAMVMWAVNECFAEMVSYLPVPSPFVRFGSEWVDGALGFAMAWNFFLNMAILVPFEIVAVNIMITFWTDKVPVEVIIVLMIVIYALLNTITVRYFGISEFYMSIFKVFLMIGLFFFTFITMIGGNPLHDAYGFRYWRQPGPFVEHLEPDGTGKFLGIVSCLYQASFSWVFMKSSLHFPYSLINDRQYYWTRVHIDGSSGDRKSTQDFTPSIQIVRLASSCVLCRFGVMYRDCHTFERSHSLGNTSR